MDEPEPGLLEEVGDTLRLSLVVAGEQVGQRIDRLLGQLLAPRFSRSYLSMLIGDGAITVDGRRVRPSYKVEAEDRVAGDLGRPPDSAPEPEDLPLAVIHADDTLIVVDKPAGMVVHPNAGGRGGTLVNALLHRFPEIGRVGRADRPGIVHRLDRDTTGLMVVARTNRAAASLVNQFKRKEVEKEYAAVVWGDLPFDSDWIDLPIGTHPKRPTLRVVSEDGRASSTFYRVERRLGPMTLLSVFPKTGRTHQIRVHLDHVGFPVVGDAHYGAAARAAFASWKRALSGPPPTLARHALHARRLTFDHPASGERVTFEAPLPDDMRDLIAVAERAP